MHLKCDKGDIMENKLCNIGILSDTHDQIHYFGKVFQYFNSHDVGLVIHCGDWVSPFSLAHYAQLKIPIYGVFGNNDGDKVRHIQYAQKFGLDAHYQDHFMSLTKFNKKIAVYHGEHVEIVQSIIKSRLYDLVLHGHDHCSGINREDNVLSINPGTLVDYSNENTQGASFALYNPETHSGRIIYLKDIE